MRALTFSGVESIEYAHVPEPVIEQGDDVIVAVRACAVCGSDLHVYHGREKGLDLHTIMGHEFSGEVVEVGRGVKKWKKGDRVMSPFTTNCGACYYCRIGLTCRCVRGKLFGWVEDQMGLPGGQAQFVRVPMADSTLLAIPDGVRFDQGVLLGDIIPTGFYCAQRASMLSGGRVEFSGVFGCGPVGLMAILGARYVGHEKIFAFDRVPSRLAVARRFGAIPMHLDEPNLQEKMLDETDGRGLDVVMEVVGSGDALRLGYQLLRPGGVLSAVGVCTESNLSFSPTQAYNKNITYATGRCPARQLMPELLPLVQQSVYDFDSIISHRLQLSEGADAYARYASREDGMLKVLLEP